MPERFDTESKGFFEKFWAENISNTFKHMIGEKIWQAGWVSAFRFLAPRIAHTRNVCEKTSKIMESYRFLDPDKMTSHVFQEYDDSLNLLKQIAEETKGYEQPLIAELKQYKALLNDIRGAFHMNESEFKDFVISLFISNKIERG